jgi:hypothetical protein
MYIAHIVDAHFLPKPDVCLVAAPSTYGKMSSLKRRKKQ